MEGGPKGSEPPRYDPVSSPSEETKDDDAISPPADDWKLYKNTLPYLTFLSKFRDI